MRTGNAQEVREHLARLLDDDDVFQHICQILEIVDAATEKFVEGKEGAVATMRLHLQDYYARLKTRS